MSRYTGPQRDLAAVLALAAAGDVEAVGEFVGGLNEQRVRAALRQWACDFARGIRTGVETMPVLTELLSRASDELRQHLIEDASDN